MSLLSTNLLTERWSRNGTLVQGLTALGIMEELGYGLNRVMQQFAAEDLPPPEFSQTDATFVVTLRGHAATELMGARPTGEEGAQAPAAVGRRRMSPPERQAWVLDHLRTVGPIGTRAYATATGVSVDTALNDLTALAARGLVEAQGTTKDRRWALRLADPAP